MAFLNNLPRLPPRGAAYSVNPINAMRALTWKQQAIFWAGWFAWLADSFDFFCVSLTILRLQVQFSRSTHALTTAITLTLLLRPVGALIFGLLADRFGRKWPLVSVLLIIAVLQIITSFITHFSAFLAIRSLYGIAMGGVWGVAGTASLENMPVGSRGLYSGLMQVAYPCGYLVASLINLLLVPNTSQTWRSIFWFGAGLSVLAAAIRAMLPDSAVFVRSREVARKSNMTASRKSKVFIQSLRKMFKEHWTLWAYGVIFITGLQFLAHSSQDLYTTFMQTSKGFSASLANEANIIGEAGAALGGALGGHMSQFLGRRITVILACIWTCVFIPLWVLPSSWGLLSTGAFFFQIGVNIAWGAIAIHLNELAPPAFRGAFPGTVHQMGNMASSASAQIVATAGLTLRKQVRGIDQPDYGTIQAIMAAASCGMVVVCTLFGPEKHSTHFEDGKTAIEEGASSHSVVSSEMVRDSEEDKGEAEYFENSPSSEEKVQRM